MNALSHNLAGTNRDVAWAFTRNAAGGLVDSVRDNDAYAYGGLIAANDNYTANGLNQYSAKGAASLGPGAACCNGHLSPLVMTVQSDNLRRD